MGDIHKKVVFAILDFFEDDKKNGLLQDDSMEKLEGALKVVESVYGVNRTDENDVENYRTSTNLTDMFKGNLTEPQTNADKQICNVNSTGDLKNVLKEKNIKPDTSVLPKEKQEKVNAKKTNSIKANASAPEEEKEKDEEEEEEEDEETEEEDEQTEEEEDTVEQYLSAIIPSIENVNHALELLGFEYPESASKCIRSAIQKRYIILKNDTDLDATGIFKATCPTCESATSCSIRDLLEQGDDGSYDYDNGAQNGALQCEVGEQCDGMYVTRYCQGKPVADNGRFHNHCGLCVGFGTCIGDSRNAHCERCGMHYFAGTGMHMSCPECGPSDSDLEFDDWY